MVEKVKLEQTSDICQKEITQKFYRIYSKNKLPCNILTIPGYLDHFCFLAQVQEMAIVLYVSSIVLWRIPWKDISKCTDSQSLDTKLKLMADIKLEMEALMAQIKTKIHSIHSQMLDQGKLSVKGISNQTPCSVPRNGSKLDGRSPIFF